MWMRNCSCSLQRLLLVVQWLGVDGILVAPGHLMWPKEEAKGRMRGVIG